jgi:type IV secretory pathway TraG/TraD family ATPase VirD4
VRRLDPSRQLLFVKGVAPLLVDRLNYLVDAPYCERADANPLYNAVVA